MDFDRHDASTPNAIEAQAAPEPEVFDIRRITPPQLAQLGVSQVAYVKPVPSNGRIAYAIHAADGTPMALAAEQGLAFAAIIQHEMIPALVH
jgi:hypothetical protein